MKIYTSYYGGEIWGEAVSISLHPPKNWQGKHLPLFAPTPELLNWWKRSPQDETAQKEYSERFALILDSRQAIISLWVERQKRSTLDITLLCDEKPEDFCHRHQVGREIIHKYLPGFWGGEIALKNLLDFSPPPEKLPLAPVVQELIKKCHDAGFQVKCDRLSCGYYHVFLEGKDLGIWGDLGVLAVLSDVQSDFGRKRLLSDRRKK